MRVLVAWLLLSGCADRGERNCTDGIDNDADGAVDANDVNCRTWTDEDGVGGGCVDDDCENSPCVWVDQTSGEDYWRSCPGEDCPCANN